MFTKLSVLADPTPDTISYSFQFDEASCENNKVTEIIHKVNPGETLFDIAYNYGVTVDFLVKLNPYVRRPDELENIKEIKVC
ncbi:MAG: LysM peptidoglycan-binding domain-containing protein [Clostridia bacterium]|nr:LysM peptidoglycan-binding domain-containing protein [Clostridia bacterium]